MTRTKSKRYSVNVVKLQAGSVEFNVEPYGEGHISVEVETRDCHFDAGLGEYFRDYVALAVPIEHIPEFVAAMKTAMKAAMKIHAGEEAKP